MEKENTTGLLMGKEHPPFIPMPFAGALLANGMIVCVAVAGWIAFKTHRELYYLGVQEDQMVEWMTFWAFMAAGFIFCQAAYRQYRQLSLIPWYLICVAIFCIFVAMEEVSWGQRLFGYRPPAYFLAQNFQQELNVHNVINNFLREMALRGVILGFGVFFPGLWLIPSVRKFLENLSVVPAPALLIPAFFTTYLLQEVYPWKYAGELVELMLGLGFAFSALTVSRYYINPSKSLRLPLEIGFLAFVLIGLSMVVTKVTNAGLQDHPELPEIARKEVIALGNDFRREIREAKSPITHCLLHNRIFAHVEKYRINGLYRGYFHNLTKQGLPEERADFFIDPWNSPYWIWQVCDPEKKQVAIYIYSFGPNRRRDSVPWQIKGDDIGLPIYTSGR